MCVVSRVLFFFVGCVLRCVLLAVCWLWVDVCCCLSVVVCRLSSFVTCLRCVV